MTPDEGAGWSLIDLAKQVFGAQNASEVGFDFVETKPDEAPPEPPAAEVAVVEQRESATAKTPARSSPSASFTTSE